MSPERGICPDEDWAQFRSHRQRWLDRLAAESERYRLEAAWRLPVREPARASSSARRPAARRPAPPRAG